MTQDEEVGFLRAVYAGMDEAIGMIARIQSDTEYEGKPAANLAAGWISGLALTEKERIKRILDTVDRSRE